MDKKEVRYTYGPVPSRRLGLSLGVDIVPAKICTLDCIYCQVGRTTEKSTVRRDFLDIEAVLAELQERVRRGLRADYVTIGGSGEPTLHSRLGELIDRIRQLTDIPVAVLTNGTLFHREDVRAECARADVVLPSLDAADEAVFEAMNRPACDISTEKLVSGLARFRDEFAGQIWLEVFLVPGLNTGSEQVEGIKEHIRRIRPDKVHLNTAVRPPAEAYVQPVPPEVLAAVAGQIGGNCEVIGGPPPGHSDPDVERTTGDVLSMLKRRPCSLADLCAGLGIGRNEAIKHVVHLEGQGLITSQQQGGTTYYVAGRQRL